MKRSRFAAGAMAGALLLASGIATAQLQPKFDLGKREYDSNCAGCHGLTGKGDGPYMLVLAKKDPADLTTLTRKNNGVFPIQRVYEVIDGRQALQAHGPRDMPIWGLDYQARAANAFYLDVPYDPEVYVRSRVLALVEYINRLQQR
ncbi:MAG TPA: cytochrome c [Burkholderiales bacterium]|nr:cytochrome c [Burkholderiales bacterium]